VPVDLVQPEKIKENMMALKINYSASQSAEEAYAKVKEVVTPEYTQKFQVKADVAYDDAKKIIKSTGTGFTLTLSFHNTYCEADLDLSFLLKALKPKILSKIEDQIKRNI
jgi:aromatic ring hydroxylase